MMPLCKPGQQVQGAEFRLDKSWTAVKSVSGPKFLKLKPGKHTVQSIVYATVKDAEDTIRKVRVLSNKVEIVIPRPDSTFHVGGKRPKSGTIRGKVVGRHSPGEQLNYTVMLEPEAWRNKHGFPPIIVVAAGKTFEFTNVPIGKCKVTASPVTTAGSLAGKHITEDAEMVDVTVKNKQVVDLELSFSDFPDAAPIERQKVR